MTRKKYIKFLMAAGYDRNSAREVAELGRRLFKSYKEAYDDFVEFIEFGVLGLGGNHEASKKA